MTGHYVIVKIALPGDNYRQIEGQKLNNKSLIAMIWSQQM